MMCLVSYVYIVKNCSFGENSIPMFTRTYFDRPWLEYEFGNHVGPICSILYRIKIRIIEDHYKISKKTELTELTELIE